MSVALDKATGTWYARIYYVDPVSGERKQRKKRGFRYKREAEAWSAEERSKSTASTGATFNAVFELYLAQNQSSSSTISSKKSIVNRYFGFKDYEIAYISKKQIIQWYTNLCSLELNSRTKNKILSLLKAIYRFAYDYYDVPDITKTLKSFRRPIEEQTEMKVWSIEEFNKFIDTIEHPIYRAFFYTLYWTGLRRGEAIALLKSDLVGNCLIINKTMRNKVQGAKVPKTAAGVRKVSLDTDTLNMLIPLSQRQGMYLFGDDLPLNPSEIERKFDKSIELSNVKRIRIHYLRHSHATVLINSGANIVAVSKRLGHSSINQTLKTYTHLLDSTNDELVDQISELKREISTRVVPEHKKNR